MKISKSLLLGLIFISTFNVSYADEIKNFSGKDRIETSLKLAYENKNKNLVIANAYSFPDSLSAFNLVSKYNAKLVLIDENTELDFSKLGDLEKIYLIGGENILKGKTIDKIKNLGIDYERIAGSDRYSTNIKTLDKVGCDKVGVADGRNYPDALASSPLLKKKGLGLMLVDGSKPYTTNRKVMYTFGGKGSISQEGGVRLFGKDRYDTNEKINKEIGEYKSDILVDGNNFADALSSINLLSLGSDFKINLVNKNTNTLNYKDVHIVGGIAEKIYNEQKEKDKKDSTDKEKVSVGGGASNTIAPTVSEANKVNNDIQDIKEYDDIKFPITITPDNKRIIGHKSDDITSEISNKIRDLLIEAEELSKRGNDYSHLYKKYLDLHVKARKYSKLLEITRDTDFPYKGKYYREVNFKDDDILQEFKINISKIKAYELNREKLRKDIELSKINIKKIESKWGEKKEKIERIKSDIEKWEEELKKIDEEQSHIDFENFRYIGLDNEPYSYPLDEISFNNLVNYRIKKERDFNPSGYISKYNMSYMAYRYVSLDDNFKSKIYRCLNDDVNAFEIINKYIPEGYYTLNPNEYKRRGGYFTNEIINGKMPSIEDIYNVYITKNDNVDFLLNDEDIKESIKDIYKNKNAQIVNYDINPKEYENGDKYYVKKIKTIPEVARNFKEKEDSIYGYDYEYIDYGYESHESFKEINRALNVIGNKIYMLKNVEGLDRLEKDNFEYYLLVRNYEDDEREFRKIYDELGLESIPNKLDKARKYIEFNYDNYNCTTNPSIIDSYFFKKIGIIMAEEHSDHYIYINDKIYSFRYDLPKIREINSENSRRYETIKKNFEDLIETISDIEY